MPPEIPVEKTWTWTGVVPTAPAGPLRTVPRPGELTVAWTSDAVLVGSSPEVVSVKVTLEPAALAVTIVWVKLRLNSVAPRNVLVDIPFASVVVVVPPMSEPCPVPRDQVTGAPGTGWP